MSRSRTPQPATARAAVEALRQTMMAAGVDEAREKAEWAVAHLLAVGRLDLRLRAEQTLSPSQGKRWTAIRDRLAAHEPLQYVLGETEFYGRRFASDARALIPRPETEELVSLALQRRPLWRRPPRVADIGTGSGAMAVTLALERPTATVIATDLSAAALALARENARRHGAEDRIEWLLGDLLDEVSPASLDAIVTNLPYVRHGEIARLERQIRDYEPLGALDGGPDGLRLIRRLIAQAPRALRRPGWLFLEIAENQGDETRALLEQAGFIGIEIARDAAGHERFALGRLERA